jgi:single-strand DNA-binding protein
VGGNTKREKDMNKVFIIGSLVKDPELNTTTSGLSVAKFTLAVQRKFKNDKGEYEADFPQIVAWRGTADFVQKYFKKGEKIAVSGSIQTRNYENSDGKKVYITEVVAEEVEKLVWSGQEKAKTEEKLEPIDDDGENSLPF